MDQERWGKQGAFGMIHKKKKKRKKSIMRRKELCPSNIRHHDRFERFTIFQMLNRTGSGGHVT
jgi:hypothetical protein